MIRLKWSGRSIGNVCRPVIRKESRCSLLYATHRQLHSDQKVVDWECIVSRLDEYKDQKKYLESIQLARNTVGQQHGNVPKDVYENLLQTICQGATKHTRRTSAELGFVLVDEMIRQGYMVPFHLLEGLYKIVNNLGNPFLRYKYMVVTGEVFLPSGRDRKKFLNQVILLHISSGDIEGALFSLREMALANAGKLRLPYHLYEILLLATLQYEDMDFSLQIMQYLYSAHQIYARTWGLFISTACRVGHYHSLEWAWKTAGIPGRAVVDDWSYLKMIEIGRTNGDYQMARWALLRSRRRKEALGNQDTTNPIAQFTSLIEAHARTGDIGTAFRIIERMHEGASKVRLRDVPELVKTLNHNHVDKAYGLFMKISKEPTTKGQVKTLIFNVICGALIGSPEILMAFFQKCQAEHIVKCDEDTMLCLLQMSRNQRDGLLTRQVFYDCNILGISPTRRMFELAISTMWEIGDENAARYYLDEMKSHGFTPREWLTAYQGMPLRT
jgi:pentatricopeptide repeat protein